MHDRHDVRPCLVNLAMNEALGVWLPVIHANNLPTAVELHDIGNGHFRWSKAARHEEMTRIDRAARADMAKAIDDSLGKQDAVGNHQIVDHRSRSGVLERLSARFRQAKCTEYYKQRRILHHDHSF